MKLIKKKEMNKEEMNMKEILAEYRKAYLEYKASQDDFPLVVGSGATAMLLPLLWFKYHDIHIPEMFMVSITPLVTGMFFYYVPKIYWTRKYNKLENIVKDYTYTYNVIEDRLTIVHKDSKIEDFEK